MIYKIAYWTAIHLPVPPTNSSRNSCSWGGNTEHILILIGKFQTDGIQFNRRIDFSVNPPNGTRVSASLMRGKRVGEGVDGEGWAGTYYHRYHHFVSTDLSKPQVPVVGPTDTSSTTTTTTAAATNVRNDLIVPLLHQHCLSNNMWTNLNYLFWLNTMGNIVSSQSWRCMNGLRCSW